MPSYLPWAIACTIFGFTLGGLVAVFFGVKVNRRLAAGDMDGAVRASNLARTFCWISGIFGLVIYLLLITGAVRLPSATG